MDKKQIFLWSLYDFANSIVFINFLLYFSQWIVIDGGLSDFRYNATFAIATVALFCTAPILAAFTDRHGGRKFFLNISTIGTFLSYGAAALLANQGTMHTFGIAILFLLGQYFYQLSFIFYNPMLADIADVSHRSRVSGIGQFSNALGQVFGLLLTLPLAGSRLAPLLPSVAVFFVLALPMMIFFKEQKAREPGVKMATIATETRLFWRKMVSFFSVSLATPMLVAFFFFNDALITVSNNYSIYMERVFAVPNETKSLLLMAILVMSAIGGIIAGWVGDRIGSLKTLKIILCAWIVALPTIALAPNFTILAVLTVIVGLLIGSVWAVTRSYMTSLLKPDEMAYGFSFYTMMERFATFAGPLAWGGIIGLLGTAGTSYRIAMAVMTIFVVIGFLFLVVWKKDQRQAA